MTGHDNAGHEDGPTIRQGATIRQTIRDVRDAAQVVGGALDAVNFIAREALPPVQMDALAGVLSHLRSALVGLEAIAGMLASQGGETGARDT